MSAAGWPTPCRSIVGTLLYEHKYEHDAGLHHGHRASPTVSGFLLSLELRYIYRRLWTQVAARHHRRARC